MAVAALLSLAACAGGDGGASPPAGGAASAEPSVEATAALAEGEFANPVLDVNFADPGALKVGDTYYAYATEGGGRHIQVSSSTDLVTWERPSEALPRLPNWTTGMTWAPEVAETSAGYVMYYTARDPGTVRPDNMGSQCLSLAVAEDPAGPFVDPGEGPLVCQADLGGSIDPFPFVDADGSRWLLWKNDGNCCGRITRMWAAPLSEDGLTLTGEPVDLGISNDAGWERHVIEAPTVLTHEGTYYLFFSANNYATDEYAVGYATSTALLGPYTDAPENPILATPDEPDNRAFGPGGQAIVTGPDGELWVLYHAWDPAFVGRSMWLDELRFEDGKPVIDGPDSGPQAAP
jgi:beta-xylosidase